VAGWQLRLARELNVDSRFLVDAKGSMYPSDGEASPLLGRTGYHRLQPTSPDWVLFVRAPAQGGVLEKKPKVVLAGDCAGFPMSDLIAFLGQARWSGVLRVVSPGGERALTLKEGEVRSALSDSVADRLGEIIYRMGFVTRAQLDQILAEVPPTRLGRALVEKQFLKAHDLYKCLNEQIQEIFHSIMLAKEGTFFLVDQDIDEKTLVHNLSVPMHGLLMDSIRKIDELAQFRKKIPHGKMVVVRKKPSDGTLEPEEDAILALVDGHRSVIELGQAGKVSEFDSTRIVYRLIEGGYVKVIEAAAAPIMTPLPQPAVLPHPSAPTPQKPAGVEQKVVRTFNIIFREVRDEVQKHGSLDPFLTAANAALKGRGLTASPVLDGVVFGQDGTVPEQQVIQLYQKLAASGQLGSEPLQALKQALSDVMFFLLFQAGELLESQSDEELARRVKDLLATVEAL
jgi:hypothetical protein